MEMHCDTGICYSQHTHHCTPITRLKVGLLPSLGGLGHVKRCVSVIESSQSLNSECGLVVTPRCRFSPWQTFTGEWLKSTQRSVNTAGHSNSKDI